MRGVGGRELIAETLKQRGAKVTLAECYQRKQPQQNTDLLDKLWMQDGLDAILITSSEAMRNFLSLAHDNAWLSHTKIIVNHPRVAEQAQQYLPNHQLSILVAEATDDQAMFACLLQEFS